MKLPQPGGCQCRAIRYKVSEAPQLAYTCHCGECQRLTDTRAPKEGLEHV